MKIRIGKKQIEIENNKLTYNKDKFDNFKPLNAQIEPETTTIRSTTPRSTTTRSTSRRSTTTSYKWWTTPRYTTTPHNEVSHNYGLNTFVKKKLTENTYIAKNDFLKINRHLDQVLQQKLYFQVDMSGLFLDLMIL